MKKILETQRLILREYTLEDAANLLRLNSDVDIMRFANTKPITTLAQAEQDITVFQQQYLKDGYGRWAVILKENNEHIGYCGLKYCAAEPLSGRDFTDIGYRFERKYWKNGFAIEAARACLEYGFEHLHLQRIVGYAPVENKQTTRVLEKIGLQFHSLFLLNEKTTAWYQLTSAVFKIKK